jgi:hypothetical protein
LFGRHFEDGLLFRVFVTEEFAPRFFVRVVRPKTGKVVREELLPPLLYGAHGGIMTADQLILEERLAVILRQLSAN